MTGALSREAVSERLATIGLSLPGTEVPPRGRYSPVRLLGGQAWVSGHTGRTSEGPRNRGTLGRDLTVDDAKDEARHAAVNLLATVESSGLLDQVQGILHLRGFVRAVDDFESHPAVIDAASEVLLVALGDDLGQHARTAIGVASLPGGAVVELEAVLAVGDGATLRS